MDQIVLPTQDPFLTMAIPALLPSLAPDRQPPTVVGGWTRPDRAPELRRQATRLESLAAGHPHPDRVRRLARDCRLRAAELELGPQAHEELLELADAMAGMAFPRVVA